MSRQLLDLAPKALFASFRLPWLHAHAAAIALTALLVFTGIDWWYFEHTRSMWMQYPMVVAGIVGFLIPFVVPLAILLLGIRRDSLKLREVAWVIGFTQAASWLIASTYKAFTGRMQPEFMTHINTIDISTDFQFGFWEHGIFWGWPSAHAATACAMAAALFVLFPRNRKVACIALPYALYITLGASIGFHWLSDAIAGALLGIAIGSSIAITYVKRSALEE